MCAFIGQRAANPNLIGKKAPAGKQCHHRPPRSFECIAQQDTGRLLESHGETRSLRPNHILTKQDQPADRVFAVISGVLASYRVGPEERPAVYGFHLPGDLITNAWPGGISPVTIKALTEARVLSLSNEAMRAIFNDDPALGFAFFQEAGELLAKQQTIIFKQGRTPVEQRVAAFFLDLGLRLGQQHGACLEITLPMRRAEIASYLGLRSATLSRVMTRWKTEGLLHLEGLKVMSFPDIGRLEALAHDRGHPGQS